MYKRVIQKIIEFCDKNNLDYYYKKNESGSEQLTIDTAINSFMFVYRRAGENRKTIIESRTDWDDDGNYVGSRISYNQLIAELRI